MVTCKQKIVRQDKFQTLKFKIILLRVETIFDCGSSPSSLFTPHPTCLGTEIGLTVSVLKHAIPF